MMKILKVKEEIHKKAKVQSKSKGMTLVGYITKLIVEDCKK